MAEKNFIGMTVRSFLTISISLTLLGSALNPEDRVSAQGQEVRLGPWRATAQSGGFELLPTTLIKAIDTSNAAWTPSSPDPSGIAYWPSSGTLWIADSEVDEMPAFFTGVNVFESSLTGTLISTCSTTDANRRGWSNEPAGLAINPNNAHVFFSDDSVGGTLHEVNPERDGIYCTADDTVTTAHAPGNGDPEGVAYGENKLFIAGGDDHKVYSFDLGPNGVLGGGDDGEVTSFDTSALGFHDLEGIEYNPDDGTLFIVSTSRNDQYIGEVSLTGELIHLYNLDYLGKVARSGLAYGPSSWNPATKSLYLVSSGIDNLVNADENDGKVWEIHLGEIPVDKDAPFVLDITRLYPSPNSGNLVDFEVIFSEAVTGVDADDFILFTTGDLKGASVSAVSGSGSTYTVTVATGKGNGTLRLDVFDRESILDRDGKTLGGLGFNNGDYKNGEVYELYKGVILLEPASLDFGDTFLHNWSPTRTLTVSNAGTGPVQLGALSIRDSQAFGQAIFLMGSTCDDLLLEAGARCTFQAAFHPVALGTVSGQVLIPSDALEGPHSIDLSGNGVCRFSFLSDHTFLAWLADWLCPSNDTESALTNSYS